MGIHVLRPGDGERAGVGPIRYRILEDGSHTGHRLGLLEATLPPGPASPPQHVHHEHDEVFIVTAGKVRFTTGDEHVDAEAGTVVVVPIDVPHTFSNPFEQTAVFIATLTPDQYVQYFRDISQLPLNEQGLLNPADVARAMSHYATEVVRPVV
jgi:mannose-6-phosphate isomerase-like protein (cupin superfamily)